MASIAFIGLGNMGSGMCANLVRSGHAVSAYDLSTDATARAAKAGAQPVTSIADAVSNVDCVVSMLPAGQHVLQVYFGPDGVTTHARPNTLFIDCSTIAVGDARTASNNAKDAGFEMLDAPVSGGVAAATAASLTFMVGGEPGSYARAEPILSAMGKTIVHAGPAGNGQVAKIANNMLLGISMIATCEAFNLAESLGLDAQTFFDISSKASGQNWSMTSYCPAPGPVPAAPSNRDYAAGFAVDMMLKDLRLASESAAQAGAQTRLGNAATETYAALSKAGDGDKDFSIIMKAIQAASSSE